MKFLLFKSWSFVLLWIFIFSFPITIVFSVPRNDYVSGEITYFGNDNVYYPNQNPKNISTTELNFHYQSYDENITNYIYLKHSIKEGNNYSIVSDWSLLTEVKESTWYIFYIDFLKPGEEYKADIKIKYGDSEKESTVSSIYFYVADFKCHDGNACWIQQIIYKSYYSNTNSAIINFNFLINDSNGNVHYKLIESGTNDYETTPWTPYKQFTKSSNSEQLEFNGLKSKTYYTLYFTCMRDILLAVVGQQFVTQ